MAVGDLARKAPPPDKLAKGAMYDEPDGDEPETDEMAAEDDKAARVGMMEDVMSALKSGNAEEACNALDAYLDARR